MAVGFFSAFFLIASSIILGGFMSYWARKYGTHGLEIWLPVAIILSYGISPVAGLIVSSLILIFSFVLFPFAIHYLGIMILCLAGLCFSTLLFPVTAVNFAIIALALTIAYNIISNLVMFFAGHNVMHLIKFALVSTFFSWLIYIKAGWWLVMLFK